MLVVFIFLICGCVCLAQSHCIVERERKRKEVMTEQSIHEYLSGPLPFHGQVTQFGVCQPVCQGVLVPPTPPPTHTHLSSSSRVLCACKNNVKSFHRLSCLSQDVFFFFFCTELSTVHCLVSCCNSMIILVVGGREVHKACVLFSSGV